MFGLSIINFFLQEIASKGIDCVLQRFSRREALTNAYERGGLERCSKLRSASSPSSARRAGEVCRAEGALCHLPSTVNRLPTTVNRRGLAIRETKSLRNHCP